MDLSRTRAKNERWRNRNSAEYERVNRRLSELCAEVDDLESATNLYNLYVQNAGRGDNITLSIIEYSKQKQLVVRGEERVNPLIVKINEEIKSFRSAGQTRVENVEWWIPSATIVCVEGIVGGLLMLAVSFAVAAPIATPLLVGSGVKAALGGMTALGCYIKAEKIKEQNAREDDFLTNRHAELERRANTAKSIKRSVQPVDD